MTAAALLPGFAPVERSACTPAIDQPGQIDVFGQAHHRSQTHARHKIYVVELHINAAGTMQQLHLTDALLAREPVA